MKFVTRPPVGGNGVHHADDDLDGALRAFFRAEMPHPWPKLSLPAGEPSGPPPRPTVVAARPPEPAPRRSWYHNPRFALAASVGLLLLGHFTLSDALKAPVTDTSPSLDSASPRHQPIQPKKGVDAAVPEKDFDINERLQQNGDGTTTHIIDVIPRK